MNNKKGNGFTLGENSSTFFCNLKMVHYGSKVVLSNIQKQ